MKPEIIVIHHAESNDGPEVNWTAIRKWHMGTYPKGPTDGPYRDIGYHAGVEMMGAEYVSLLGRSWFWDGAHTRGYNYKALGLCVVGNFTDAPPAPAQLEKAAEICATWIWLYHLKVSNIFYHSELNTTDCPGKAFPQKNEFLETYVVPKLIGTVVP